jgi:hypothetical protein
MAKIPSDQNGWVQHRPERADAGRDDPDHPTKGSTAHQRQAGEELDPANDDRDPPPCVEGGERVHRAVEEMCVPSAAMPK